LATTGFDAGLTILVMSMGVVTWLTPLWVEPSARVTSEHTERIVRGTGRATVLELNAQHAEAEFLGEGGVTEER